MKSMFNTLKQPVAAWIDDDAPTLGAALAYYAIFSIAPLLMIAIAISALMFGEKAARGQIVKEIQGLIGNEGAAAVQSMLQGASSPAAGTIATIVGIVTLIFGGSGVFGQLQTSLNKIWSVPPVKSGGWMLLIRRRFLSFGMVLGVGFLLLISLVLTTWLTAASKYVGDMMPGGAIIGETVNVIVSFAVITLLFAMIFKVLPDAKTSWRHVWFGAAVTAGLFTLGKVLIGLYLGRAAIGSAYGAAGSLIVLLLWVYYSSQILFLGAEITKVTANEAKTHNQT